jgi:hypothetical protein
MVTTSDSSSTTVGAEGSRMGRPGFVITPLLGYYWPQFPPTRGIPESYGAALGPRDDDLSVRAERGYRGTGVRGIVVVYRWKAEGSMRWLVAAVLMLSLGACDKKEPKTTGPQPGAEGGKCYGNNTCNEPLSCAGGYCVPLKKDEVSTTSTANEGAANKAEGKQASAEQLKPDRVSSSSHLPKWKHYTFSPTNLVDGALGTSWQPNAKKTLGVGQWVTFEYDKTVSVSKLRIANGFQRKDELGDLFRLNSRARVIVALFDDGRTVTIVFDESRRGFTEVQVTPPARTKTVRLLMRETTKGTKWADLALSEVEVFGRDMGFEDARRSATEGGNSKNEKEVLVVGLEGLNPDGAIAKLLKESEKGFGRFAELVGEGDQVEPGHGSAGLGLKGADAADIGEPIPAALFLPADCAVDGDGTGVRCRKGRLRAADFKFIAGLKKLKQLWLKRTVFRAEGLKHIRSLRALKELKLDKSSITDEGLKHVASITQLETLDLDETQVTNEGVRHLARLTSLEHLDISETNVSDQALQHIAGLKKLRYLNLRKTEISDKGLKHITGLKRLRKINLHTTWVTEKGVKALIKLIPGLEAEF